VASPHDEVQQLRDELADVTYVDPEPDWSTDPAIDQRTGTRYYSNGRVVDGFGREIEPGYTPQQIEAQRRAAWEYPKTGYPDIERAPF